MPIILQNREYTDIFGNIRNFYKSNAGDKQYLRLTLKESISVQTSPLVTLSLDPINNIVTWVGGSFEDEGFRVGDTILFEKHNSGGGLITSWTTLCVSVNGNQIDVNSIPTWYDFTAGEIMVIAVDGRTRQGMRMSINHVANGTQGNALSLIDGEATQCVFDLTTPSPYLPSFVNKQSGQFAYNATLTFGGASGIYRTYFLDVEVVNSGIYNEQWFSTNQCLKVYIETAWQSLLGEPFANQTLVISENADSGWFDEPYNQDVVDATLIQGIDEIYFDQPTIATITFESGSNERAVGFAYIPQNDSYYKNVFPNQSTLTGILTSQQPIGVMVGEALPNGGTMSLEVLSFTNVGGNIYDAQIKFTPDALYTQFMQNLPEQDRLFYAWLKVGNMNLLLHNAMLVENVPVGGYLTLETSAFDDHSYNNDTYIGNVERYTCNIEDDVAYFCSFLVDNGTTMSQFNAIVEAHNYVTGESFDLQNVTFDLTQIPMQNGVMPIDVNAQVNSILPTTSVKRTARFWRDSGIDTGSQYGMRLHFPFLIRWEYWLQQANANGDFYPNQNKDWLNYENIGDWSVRVKIESIQNGLSFVSFSEMELLPYNHNDNIVSQIELVRVSTGQVVNSIIQGEMMKVVSTHESLAGDWEQGATWGMITIEPKESAPRWICSTIIDFDNNQNNPLTPIVGSVATLSFPTPTIAKIECYFDTNKINIQNMAKFTSKIKQNCDLLPIQKSTTTFEDKITTENINKVTS